MHRIDDGPSQIIVISHTASVKEAANRMLSGQVGCLIVNNDEGRFVGILTERDIVDRAVAGSKPLDRTCVAEIMTTNVISCLPETSTAEARELMTSHRIRHLPIVDNGVVVGMVSARDLMAQQLLEDRAAAEEVAMFSTCLKSIDIHEVANIVTREVPKLFQAEKAVLFFHSPTPAAGAGASQKPALVKYYRCYCPEEFLSQFSKDAKGVKDGQSLEFARDGKLVESFYCGSCPEICKELGGESFRLVIPLKISGLNHDKSGSVENTELIGYLCMCGLAPSFAKNRELINYKAKLTREILNSHLTNAHLYQQARLTSLTDALTGVGTRKLFEDKLQAECDRAKRYKRTFSVAIIDLDNFKTINDVLGHAAGDEALKCLADCMNSKKRKPDIIARYGGDEFVILMPETKANNVVRLLERLRNNVHKIKLAKNLSMTISCGIAQSENHLLNSPSELVRRADLSLYEAKAAGRDCVKVWDQSMSKRLSAIDLEAEKIKKLQRRVVGLSEQAERMFIQSIWGLVQALEAKDAYAKKHSENVMHYAVGIAEIMGIGPKQIEIIQRAAMLHDIGKIGVPDTILTKCGKVTPLERQVIEQHPLIAIRILDKMSFLEQEIAIVRSHHEKWNGQGYPDGLSKTDIPFGARILAVADTFDALISDRPYRRCHPVSEALKIIVDSAGYEFDPDVINSLVTLINKICSETDKKLEDLTPQDLLNSLKNFNGTDEESQPATAGRQSKSY